jgi:hypothetical protein
MEQVAPITRHLFADTGQMVLIWLHVLVVPFTVLWMTAQWAAAKGTPQHVRRGRSLVAVFVPLTVLSGFALLLHNLIRPEQLGGPPAGPIIPTFFIGKTFLTAFGLGITACLANGILPLRRLRRLWPLHLLNAAVLVFSVLFYQTLLLELFTGYTDSYSWELSLELALLGSLIPVVAGANLIVLVRVSRGTRLNWGSHHRMNMVFLTAAVVATLSLFLAHDRYWIFEGGLPLTSRMLMELVPASLFLAGHFPFIYGYLAGALRSELADSIRARGRT